MNKSLNLFIIFSLRTTCFILAFSCSNPRTSIKTESVNLSHLENKEGRITLAEEKSKFLPSSKIDKTVPSMSSGNEKSTTYTSLPLKSSKSANSSVKKTQESINFDVINPTSWKKLKAKFPDFNFGDSHKAKQNIVSYLNRGEVDPIQEKEITTFIDLGNGSKFCTIRKKGFMCDYNGDGFMNAGNAECSVGGGLAEAFGKKFGFDKIQQALAKKGIKNIKYGGCEWIKIDWMKGDHTQNKDLFYAVGCIDGKCFRDPNKIWDEKLFYVTIEFLLNNYSNGSRATLSVKNIEDLFGDNYQAFKEQVNCNYLTIELAYQSARAQNKTAENPYYLSTNPISTAIWGFNKNAAAYINLAIMYFMTSQKKCENICINMWSFNDGEDTPYIEALSSLKTKAVI